MNDWNFLKTKTQCDTNEKNIERLLFFNFFNENLPTYTKCCVQWTGVICDEYKKNGVWKELGKLQSGNFQHVY